MSFPSNFGTLRLDDALRLLKQSGLPLTEAGEVFSTAQVQGIIDGLCSLSSCDALTGLANRRQFLAVLAQELDRVLRTGAPMALLLADVDHFKQVNDSFGHLAGDNVLQALAQRVRDTIRPMDSAARYGGEEFAVILPNCLPVHAARVAERIRKSIAETPIALQDGRLLSVTLSIGGACVAPWQAIGIETLFSSADAQLYRAKHAGRNRALVDTDQMPGVSEAEKAALLTPGNNEQPDEYAQS